MTATDLPVMLSDHGEVVPLLTAEHLLAAAGIQNPQTADVEQLAAFCDNLEHLAQIGREARQIISDELLQRMDKRGRWTVHVDGFKITAPSPEAGKTRYDNEQLAATVERLVQEDAIDPDAAVAAIEWYQPPAPEPYWKQKPAGIRALLKIGGKAADAVEACRVQCDPPRRTVRVKRERTS